MGLLDAYQESTDTALRVMASQPLEPEPVTPKHSAWTTPFRAVAAGAAEVAGNVMDTAGAFGQVAAAVGGVSPGFDPDAGKNRQASVDVMETLKNDGINWRTDEAQQAYKFGADLRPDPLTAGTAETMVFGLTKGITKAIGAAVALGPVAGATAFGASEGMTAAEDLAEQGVDQATRTKVGAVTAAMNTAGVLLPVAGQTLKQTAGLVAVGGPGSFIAQQMATREILSSADYGAIAQQYDPLDPVGLAVATLVPAGFAAYAKRAGFSARPAPRAEGQPIAENAPVTQETGAAATPEAIDAAMVQNLNVLRDLHESTRPEGEVFKADIEPPAVSRVTDDAAVKDSLTPEQPTDTTPDAYRARVDQLLTEQPDMVSRLDDAGQPVKLADELETIRKQAREGTDTEFGADDAPLLQVAVECALSIGTAGQ